MNKTIATALLGLSLVVGSAYGEEIIVKTAPPRAIVVWIAPRWEHRHDGYVFIEGRWR